MPLAVHAALILVQMLFVTLAIAGRFVLPEFPATVLIVFRVVGAGVLLAALNWARGGAWAKSWRDLAGMAVLGLFGITLNQSLFIFGLSHSTAINATILITMTPVFTVVGSMLIGRERASGMKLAGIGLAFAGTVYLIGPDRVSLAPGVTYGNVLIVLGMLCYATYFLAARRMLDRYDALSLTTHVMLTSALTVLPLGLPALRAMPFASVRPIIWFWVAWIVVGPTLFSYLLNVWALRRVSSNAVAVYIYLQPVLTAAVAPLVLRGETLSLRTVVAGAMIFAGVLVVLRSERGSAARERRSLRISTES